jgi:predicted flap endonuclease-1-like 5' DNA nuclease
MVLEGADEMAHDHGAHDNGGLAGNAEPELETAMASAETLQLNALTGSVPPLLPARTPLSERIVALPPARSMEAFRTKVKVKAPTASAPPAEPAATAPAPTESTVTGQRAGVPLAARDDLTRIRGIDAALASRLATVGVRGFADIAAWGQGDVQTISQTLDLGRTISRQNWIEQAAQLSGPSKVVAAASAAAKLTETVALPVAPAAPAAPSIVTASLVPPPPIVPVPEVPVVTPPVVVAAPVTLVRLPPVVPVPEIPATVVAEPVAPVAVTEVAPLADAVLAQPAPLMLLPRVVAVDSPGDAKFHRAVVVIAATKATAMADAPAQSAPVLIPLAQHVLLPPVVPVPEVPQPPKAVVAEPVLSAGPPWVAMDRARAPDPFEVPVPVVPEAASQLVVPDTDVTAGLLPELASDTAVLVSPLSLPPSLPSADLSAAVGSPEQATDAVLATQLHAAVSAVADDRAVAATIDLLSAFSPPPVADDPGFPGSQSWPPNFPHVSSDPVVDPAAEAQADLAFTRWVPTTPMPSPAPMASPTSMPSPASMPSAAVEARGRTDAWVPSPWVRSDTRTSDMQMSDTRAATSFATERQPDQPQMPPPVSMRAAAQAVAASAATPGPPPIPTDWSRSRWTAAEPAVNSAMLEPTALAPPPLPEPLPLPETMPPEPRPLAPLEPVAPNMLDRLASLEAELSALAANDQPRGHVAAPSVPVPAYRGLGTPQPLHPAPQPVAPPAPPRRAGVRSTADVLPPSRSGVGGEADVMIVARGADQIDIRPVAQGPSIGTLEQRMRRARPTPEVDVETYAGYHGAIGEASVEIVRRDTHTRAVVYDDSGERADDSSSRSREGSVRKFFKALKGDAN